MAQTEVALLKRDVFPVTVLQQPVRRNHQLIPAGQHWFTIPPLRRARNDQSGSIVRTGVRDSKTQTSVGAHCRATRTPKHRT